MWIGSLYKNGPTQHICMSGVHSSTYYFSFGHHWIELTNILLEVYTLPKIMSLNVNMIAWLEFELAYRNIAVQHISHYPMDTPLLNHLLTVL